MINLINGSLLDPQENIQWVENKPSATVILNTHVWKEGEILIVGYKIKGDEKEIMIGIGIQDGLGPSCYRVIIDRSVFIVTEVLDYQPDISYYAFDQRYLITDEEGNLFFTRRFFNPEIEGIEVESIKIENRCIVIESSTGDIWICDPPTIRNFFELTTRPIIKNITDLGFGKIKIDIEADGVLWEDLCFIQPDEVSYLSEAQFEKNFVISMESQKYGPTDEPTNSLDPGVVAKTIYTLRSNYSENPIDLDEIPEGWTKINQGVYTKTIIGNTSSESGEIPCTLTVSGYTGTKFSKNIKTRVDKYVFIIYSSQEFSEIKRVNKLFLSESSNLGSITITPHKNSYAWFAFPKDMIPERITQMGMNYVSQDTILIENVIKQEVNIGDYILYKSINPGNGEPQEIVIYGKD